jgi:hypothetical protein
MEMIEARALRPGDSINVDGWDWTVAQSEPEGADWFLEMVELDSDRRPMRLLLAPAQQVEVWAVHQ